MKSLEFGVIGVGRFGKHYVRLLADFPGVQLKTTANNSEEAKKLLIDPTIDCIIIATPATSHGKLINMAVNFGKHILVEKPMVSTVVEARSIQAALARNPVTFMVGFQYVYNDYVRRVREIVQGGSLGKILYVLGENLYCGPIRADVGCFVDTAAHELSMVQYLFNPGKVQKVRGRCMNFGSLLYDDFTAATIQFENGLVTHMVTSRFAPQKTRRFTVVGENGSVVFDDMKIKDKISIFEHTYPSTKEFANTTKSIPIASESPSIPTIVAGEALHNQLEHFIHCVNTREHPITNINFGSWVTEQTEIILENIQRA